MANLFTKSRTPGSLTSAYAVQAHLAESNPHPQYLLTTEVVDQVSQLFNQIVDAEAIVLYSDPSTDDNESHVASMLAFNSTYEAIVAHAIPFDPTATSTNHQDSSGLELYARRQHTHDYSDLSGVAAAEHTHNGYVLVGDYIPKSELLEVGIYDTTPVYIPERIDVRYTTKGGTTISQTWYSSQVFEGSSTLLECTWTWEDDEFLSYDHSRGCWVLNYGSLTFVNYDLLPWLDTNWYDATGAVTTVLEVVGLTSDAYDLDTYTTQGNYTLSYGTVLELDTSESATIASNAYLTVLTATTSTGEQNCVQTVLTFTAMYYRLGQLAEGATSWSFNAWSAIGRNITQFTEQGLNDEVHSFQSTDWIWNETTERYEYSFETDHYFHEHTFAYTDEGVKVVDDQVTVAIQGSFNYDETNQNFKSGNWIFTLSTDTSFAGYVLTMGRFNSGEDCHGRISY